MASHEAARRAVKAGYKDVSVMVDGIMGWKDAGQPTAAVGNSKVGNS
jgi:rhodanese-related sulfurtransferase